MAAGPHTKGVCRERRLAPYLDRMRKLPAGITHESLPDLGHYRGHRIDRMRVWCHAPMCSHEARLSFDELAAFGATDRTKLWDIGVRLRCTRCGGQAADVQPDWSQMQRGRSPAVTWGMLPPRIKD